MKTERVSVNKWFHFGSKTSAGWFLVKVSSLTKVGPLPNFWTSVQNFGVGLKQPTNEGVKPVIWNQVESFRILKFVNVLFKGGHSVQLHNKLNDVGQILESKVEVTPY